MENIVTSNITKPTWLQNRCRDFIFKQLAQLLDGELSLVEPDSTKHRFGQRRTEQCLNAEIRIHDWSCYRDWVINGSIGAAEAYIENKWSTSNLTQVIRLFAKAQKITDKLESKQSWWSQISQTLSHWANKNSLAGSKKNIIAHYDLGNELYTRFLDKEMMYSSAIYPDPNATLEQAQLNKLDAICQKLDLKPSDHLLEIGTGWGGLAVYAASHFGCKVTTTTISEEQFAYAEQRINELGLQDSITLLKQDYRTLEGTFDKLVSIEMIEAVGYRYLPEFFKICNDRLKPNGKMLIQAITIADQRFEPYKNSVDFIQKYIFPGGFLPCIAEMTALTQKKTHLVVEGVEDIGLHYAKTLAHWRERFLLRWHEIKHHGYDDTFKRLWLYYFGYCEGAFLERSISTVQMVLRK
ncbi:class I SAM-dependent methyltransferase [Parashewanella curva]|uniref:Class I SAM-dependent methyltransferase n=1 Tax=Parashewanella curva TaxID=2338552 RepID=A0A3L8Q1U6_9GAMM|nr:cyclopropane-fatty-acyl-phospholipid synthase family protein [Parashewanella curva]RLV61611.1 class I SAM-dependent methyltransferase [Parashewanella curva]